MQNRRDFIGSTLAALGASALIKPDSLFAAPAPKRILILGGTGFIGPHNVRRALAQGHQVTIFNRGRTAPGAFGKDVEELIGDRASDLSALRGKRWDAVLDESASLGSAREWVRASATLLKDSVDQYLFISSRSAYADTSRVPMTADAPTLERASDPGAGEDLPYGYAKAYAEKEARAIMPGRVAVIRPGLIIGPGDDTDRFTWWPWRVARGGEMIAPGDGTDHVQIIDVRDLAAFAVTLMENKTMGTFNGVGPQMGQPFKTFLTSVQKGVGGNATFTWVAADFLRQQGASPYGRELPVFQVMTGRTAGFARFDISPELKAGLTIRPTEVTAKDTLEWFKTLPPERQVKTLTGFTPEREKTILTAWKARGGGRR